MYPEMNIYKTAFYIRLSREDREKKESNSISAQRMLLKEFIKGKDEFVFICEYTDDGWTGTNFERPAFLRMIRDIEEKKIDCIIVKDLSRLGRDYIGTGNYIERYFPQKGVRFISVNDNIDSSQMQYDMIIPIKNVFNEQYTRDISKKVVSSLRTRQKKGMFIGSFACYGYLKSKEDRHKLTIDGYAADVVRRIFAMFNEGYSRGEIAQILNKEGILPPGEYKAAIEHNYSNGYRYEKYGWSYNSVHQILKREMYIGNMVQHVCANKGIRTKQRKLPESEFIRVENTHPAIIEKEVWDRAQELLTKNGGWKRKNDNSISLFAGIIYCGDCGRAMVKYRSGEKVYYTCATYRKYGKNLCTKHSIRCDILEQIVLEDLNSEIEKLPDLKNIIKKEWMKTEEWKKKKSFVKQWEQARKRKEELYDDYKNGLLTKQEFINYRDKYCKILSEYQERANGFEEERYPEFISELSEKKSLGHLYRSVLLEAVSRIEIYEKNKITIAYTFSKYD